ncbi:MAG: ABC transporter substrate-binding protein [Xanthomonadales bacterium]|nr:ABC transporter substrate-binding protein [Xanthomonadales bacterium]
MMRALLASVFFAAALSLAPVHADPATATATASPQQVVKSIANQLATQLGDHRDELKHDRDKLIKVIDSIFLPHFDIDYASILVLGRHAREATPAQRERFAKAFYNSITHRYAEGLLNYTKGSVKVLPFKGDVNEKRTIVRTQVILNDGKRISVDYAFRKTHDGSWKAYDVIIEGISYITNYRNQVDAEIRKEGIESLIDRLETQGSKALESMDKDAGK